MTNACPRCSAVGRRVRDTTIRAIVKDRNAQLVDSRFCRTRECPVVYYGSGGETAGEDAAIVRVGAKHTDDGATLCYCFGYTLGDVRSEIARSGSSTVAEHIRQRIADEGCACETRNPAGVCCLGDVNAAIREAKHLPSVPQDVLLLKRALIRLLSEGRPVALERIAGALGWSPDDVCEVLAKLPTVEFDDSGHVVASGISLTPTRHSFVVGGQRLFTWCALDALIFPVLLGKPASVTSRCPSTAKAIRVEVSPDGVESVDPVGSVVSLVMPQGLEKLRDTFCNRIHFFADTDAAAPWLAENPDAVLVPVVDARQAGKLFMESLIGSLDYDDELCC